MHKVTNEKPDLTISMRIMSHSLLNALIVYDFQLDVLELLRL